MHNQLNATFNLSGLISAFFLAFSFFSSVIFPCNINTTDELSKVDTLRDNAMVFPMDSVGTLKYPSVPFNFLFRPPLLVKQYPKDLTGVISANSASDNSLKTSGALPKNHPFAIVFGGLLAFLTQLLHSLQMTNFLYSTSYTDLGESIQSFIQSLFPKPR